MGSHRARACSMKFLLVCTAIASASAAPQLLGYPYSLGAAYPYPLGAAYPYAANIVKPVVKEIEVPVPTIKYVAGESDCKNSFGAPVPCARRRRDADDEEAAEAPVVAPAVFPMVSAVAAPVIKPTITEVEVPQYKFVPEVKEVELPLACHNAFGWPVPCAA